MKTLIAVSLIVFLTACSDDYEYRCTENDKTMIKDSFDNCIDQDTSTNNIHRPYQCSKGLKNMFCKKVIIND